MKIINLGHLPKRVPLRLIFGIGLSDPNLKIGVLVVVVVVAPVLVDGSFSFSIIISSVFSGCCCFELKALRLIVGFVFGDVIDDDDDDVSLVVAFVELFEEPNLNTPGPVEVELTNGGKLILGAVFSLPIVIGVVVVGVVVFCVVFGVSSFSFCSLDTKNLKNNQYLNGHKNGLFLLLNNNWILNKFCFTRKNNLYPKKWIFSELKPLFLAGISFSCNNNYNCKFIA